LRSPFGRGDDEAGWAMRQSNAGFDLVAMLSAGAARHEKFQIAIAFE
jgi:hypothetical protein